jgi:peptide/nickel transport system permease protein
VLHYLSKRILHSAISLVGLVVLVFFLARLTGNPAILYLPVETSSADIQAFADRHGFNDPVIVQFGHFLNDLAHLDFGQSLRMGQPALDVVLHAFPTTLKLAAITMAISLVVAIVTGALAAWRPDGVFDRTTTVLSLLGASAPSFWIAIVGILVFAVGLHWLPTSGMGGPAYWVLPVAVLVLRPVGVIAQVVRGSMISALSSSYVKTARAKGAPPRRIIFVHALRNAMLPGITVAGDQAASILNGAVVVETIFGFTGIGNLLIEAITYRDFAVLQVSVLFIALAVFLLNIVIDVAYVLLDPRVSD